MSKAQEIIHQQLAVPAHANLHECTSQVKTAIEHGRRYVLQSAILITEAKSEYFGDDYKGWLAWCADEFGYGRSMANKCNVAGRFLQRHAVHRGGLTRCEPGKLEAIAALPSDSAVQAWLAVNDPTNMSRTAIRKSVADYAAAAAGLDADAQNPNEGDQPPGPPNAPPEEPPAETLTRLQKLQNFDAARIDVVLQLDYLNVYGWRLQDAARAQFAILLADDRAKILDGLRELRDNLDELLKSLPQDA